MAVVYRPSSIVVLIYNETTYTPDVTGNWWGTNAPGALQFSGPAIVISLSAGPATVVVRRLPAALSRISELDKFDG